MDNARKNQMKISVVIPTFNRGHFLAYSLYLYAKQTMRDFEIIIIDDGSTDNTFEVCKAFNKFFKIRYFYSNRKDGLIYQSGGPLINFAVKNIALGNIILYSDAEVMPFPNFVENHYKSHQPGTIIVEPMYIAPDIPGKIRDNIIIKDGDKNFIKGLTLKTWFEHGRFLGYWEDWRKSGTLKNIEQFWNDMWAKVMSLPKNYIGDPNMGYGYADGEQHFWGFQGSQAGLSFLKNIFMKMQGWDESLDRPGRWMGEDGELGARATKWGVGYIENPNIKAVHIYHPKPPTYTDEEKKTLVTNKIIDPNYKVANQNIEWGNAERLKIKEIEL